MLSAADRLVLRLTSFLLTFLLLLGCTSSYLSTAFADTPWSGFLSAPSGFDDSSVVLSYTYSHDGTFACTFAGEYVGDGVYDISVSGRGTSLVFSDGETLSASESFSSSAFPLTITISGTEGNSFAETRISYPFDSPSVVAPSHPFADVLSWVVNHASALLEPPVSWVVGVVVLSMIAVLVSRLLQRR